MDQALSRAYSILTGHYPDDDMPEWKIASEVTYKWDTRLLGEELAQECIFRIVNHTVFPTQDKTREIVGIAEDRATELFPELEGVDPHMDVIAHLELIYHERNVSERGMNK